MGGHGALTLALKHPERFKSCSAFAPIVHPSTAGWSRPAFKKYLGNDESHWRAWDTISLIEACQHAGVPLTLSMHKGYDHSYYFISTFMNDYLNWHAARLSADEFPRSLR